MLRCAWSGRSSLLVKTYEEYNMNSSSNEVFQLYRFYFSWTAQTSRKVRTCDQHGFLCSSCSYLNEPLLLRTANALMDYWVTCQYRDCIDWAPSQSRSQPSWGIYCVLSHTFLDWLPRVSKLLWVAGSRTAFHSFLGGLPSSLESKTKKKAKTK